MAAIDDITFRASFTTAALATMNADPEWDRLLADYLKYDALQFADAEWGSYAKACNQYTLDVVRMEDKHGPGWKAIASLRPSIDAMRAQNDAANDVWIQSYIEPYWAAARALVEYPAPTLAAALLKVQIIHREEVWNDTAFTGNCMDVILSDMDRVANKMAA